MSSASPMLRLRRAVVDHHGAMVVIAAVVLLVQGTFRDLRGEPLPIVAALVLGAFLVMRLAMAAGMGQRAAAAPAMGTRAYRRALQRDVELGALLLVSASIAFQATGGPHSVLHPLSYALVAFLVTFQRRAVGLPLVVLAMVLELAVVRACPLTGDWPTHRDDVLLASHLSFLGLFAALHFVLLTVEVRRQRAEHRALLADEVSRLHEEARDFRLIGSQLAAESRARSREQEEEIIAAASVENIHQALFYTLELLKKSLDLHTCVLLWLDESDALLRIKELSTDSDAIAEAPIPAGVGAVGAVVKDRLPVRIDAPKSEHLPYYDRPQPVGAFLGVPVIEEAEPFLSAGVDGPVGTRRPDALGSDARHRGHLRGVLCADRLVTHVHGDRTAGIPFDQRDQALLVGAAREILRAIQAERVFVAVERGKYEHERFFRASDLLNRALTPEQVHESAFRAARELCEYDFAAISLFDKEGRRHRIAAAVGEGASELQALSFGDNAGLAAMVMKTRHPLPAGGEWRDKETPVFTKKARLRGMESLLVLPLIVGDEAIGAFTLAARAPRRFPKDKRELLGVIANQVAVSIKNAEMYRLMEQMATTDGLTGLLNHRTFQERFADLLHRAERQGRKVTLLLTDVDHFKKVNDTYGHPIGDQVLKGVAAIARSEVRKIDVAARYGGEEFAIVLDGTDREGGRQLAERIRAQVQARTFNSPEKGDFHCTLSLGISTYPDDGRDAKTLIANADQALYHAKHNGRNRAIAWTDFAAQPLRAVH